jgi:hypothetical protein
MILKTHGAVSGLRFIVLIPHRDTGGPLRALRRDLFAAGIAGAFSFPPLAPVALVSRPFTVPELRGLARTLREASLAGGRDGTISAGEPASLTCPGGLSLYGPVLDLGVPELPPGAVFRFPFLAICAALIGKGDKAGLPHPFKAFSFRAAAVANMILTPLDCGEPGYSYRWQIGIPRWLPSPRHIRREG